MNIIILGAGQVGATLAQHLVREDHDLTIVDQNPKRLSDLHARMDISTVVGNASYPHILRQAGASDADMLIAVTNSDEANMVACQIAHILFQVPTKIARIRAQPYLAYQELFGKDALAIDHFICPEQIITEYIRRLIDNPGTLQVLNFAHGKCQLVAVQPFFGGAVVGKTIQQLPSYVANAPMRVVAIYRGTQSIPVYENTVIELGDEVFFMCHPSHTRSIIRAMRRTDEPYKRVMIAGGGNIGMRLAMALEGHYQVKMLEQNTHRCQFLAESLSNTTVILGEASDRDLLVDENIDYTDVFCALTNDNEVNILSAMQAKHLGARQVISLINHTPYVDLIEGGDIDIVVTPQQATIGSILTHIRRGDIVQVHSLRRGMAEAIEIIVHGDKETSPVIGRKVTEIDLPPGTAIGAIIRDEQILFDYQDVELQAEDHVIFFLSDKKYLYTVERLFQVSATFV